MIIIALFGGLVPGGTAFALLERLPADGQDAQHLASPIRNPGPEICHDCFSQQSRIRGPVRQHLSFSGAYERTFVPSPVRFVPASVWNFACPVYRRTDRNRMVAVYSETEGLPEGEKP